MSVAVNSVVRTTTECWRRCGGGDTEGAADLMHPDFVHDDRRPLVANTLTNRDDTIRNNCAFVEMGFSIELEPVAVHGERLALVRAIFTDARGNEIAALQVLTLDEDGLRTGCVSFDDDDRAGAMGEFEARRRHR